MRSIFVTTIAAVILCGCATQRTTLTETVNVDGTYTKTTEIFTRTLFDSKTELAKLKTSSTEKTQSVGISDLHQETSASNAVNLVEIAVQAAVKAAVSSVVPVK